MCASERPSCVAGKATAPALSPYVSQSPWRGRIEHDRPGSSDSAPLRKPPRISDAAYHFPRVRPAALCSELDDPGRPGPPHGKRRRHAEALSDPSAPLVFPWNFSRFSAPDANSCAGCHNVPIMGGAGDIVANVFVLGQRFDSRSFRRDRDARRPRRAREFRESARLRQLPRHARHVRGRLVAASGSRDPGRPSEDRKSDPARPDRRSGLEGDRFRKAIP